MSKNNWKSTNLRLGASPLELQQMDKEDNLGAHLNVGSS